MKKRPSSSPSMSNQLQIWTPQKKRESSSRRMDVAIVSTSHGTSFNLPDDWIFEERKRTTGTHIGRTDKYYREPGTGRTFRSLASVRKYLMELDDYAIARTRREENQITVYRKTYIPKHHVKIDRSKPLKLPKGWYIRRITRMSGHSMGRVDKYYCERSTGRVFRSRLDVQRYLAANHINDNTTLSELFKPAGLIQMSKSEDKDICEESAMAIVPHSSYKDSYSSISDDVPLKDLVRKRDDVPLKDLVRKCDDVPLKDLVPVSDDMPLKDLAPESDDMPLEDLVPESDEMPLKDLVPQSDDMPLKDLFRKSSTARKTNKSSNKLASQKKHDISSNRKTNTSSMSNPPTKIKWVLEGPGGDAWCPFIGDTMVPKSLNQEWAQMFVELVSQKQSNASSSDQD